MKNPGTDFDDFVAARGSALARTAYLLTADRHLAEDLLQSALAKAAPRWHRLADPEAYLRRTMYTEHISWWRRRRHIVETPLTSEVDVRASAAYAAPAHDDVLVDRDALRTALLQLAPRQRAVVVLRYYEDLTEGQAADVLGVSIGTVKSQTHAALKRLRALAPELAGNAPTPSEELR